jgi:putative ABC transporter-associated repeat protein
VSDPFVLAVAVGTADVMEIDPAHCGDLVDTGPIDDAPPPAGDDGADAPASQQVAATQCVAGATILSSGHIDYSSRIVGGKLESLIGDDTSGTKVYREPSGTILWLKPSSVVTLPSGYGSVGPAGSRVWQVPQTQNLDLIWLGWSTESLNAGNTRGSVSWTINSIDGPGSVKVYLSGAFGGVQQMVFNNGGSYQISQGVHAHANWAFSAEGIYRINMTQTATLANGQSSSDTETLTIVVGNVDPASAAGSGSGCGTVSNALLLSDDTEGALKAADQAAANAALAARGVLPGQGSDVDGGFTDPFTALAQDDTVPLLLSILGLLLIVGAAGSGVLWWRSRRRGVAV